MTYPSSENEKDSAKGSISDFIPTEENVTTFKKLLEEARTSFSQGAESMECINQLRNQQAKFYQYFEPKLRADYYMRIEARARPAFEDILHDALIEAFEIDSWMKLESKTGFRHFELSKNCNSSIEGKINSWLQNATAGGRLKYRVLDECRKNNWSLDQEIGDSGASHLDNQHDPKTSVDEAEEGEQEVRERRLRAANKLRGYKKYLSSVYPQKFSKCNGWAIISLLLSDETGYFYKPSGACNQKKIASHFEIPEKNFSAFSSWFKNTLLPLLKKLSDYEKEENNE